MATPAAQPRGALVQLAATLGSGELALLRLLGLVAAGRVTLLARLAHGVAFSHISGFRFSGFALFGSCHMGASYITVLSARGVRDGVIGEAWCSVLLICLFLTGCCFYLLGIRL